mgnify:CR=1 FL=1
MNEAERMIMIASQAGQSDVFIGQAGAIYGLIGMFVLILICIVLLVFGVYNIFSTYLSIEDDDDKNV